MGLWDKLMSTCVVLLLFFAVCGGLPRCPKWAVHGVFASIIGMLVLVMWRVWT